MYVRFIVIRKTCIFIYIYFCSRHSFSSGRVVVVFFFLRSIPHNSVHKAKTQTVQIVDISSNVTTVQRQYSGIHIEMCFKKALSIEHFLKSAMRTLANSRIHYWKTVFGATSLCVVYMFHCLSLIFHSHGPHLTIHLIRFEYTSTIYRHHFCMRIVALALILCTV